MNADAKMTFYGINVRNDKKKHNILIERAMIFFNRIIVEK